MAAADFYLGEGDTAPPFRLTCRGRATAADPDGPIVDLTDAEVEFVMAVEDPPEVPPEEPLVVTADAEVVDDPELGVVEISWVDGYPPGRYLGRLKVTLADESTMSFPPDRNLLIVVTEDP